LSLQNELIGTAIGLSLAAMILSIAASIETHNLQKQEEQWAAASTNETAPVFNVPTHHDRRRCAPHCKDLVQNPDGYWVERHSDEDRNWYDDRNPDVPVDSHEEMESK